MDTEGFSHGVTFTGEEWRTAILTCDTCGAAVLLSRTVDTVALHRAWHAGQES